MTNNVFKKGLVIGIIILFLGASLLPVINAKIINQSSIEIKNVIRKNTNLDKPQHFNKARFVTFTLTFYEKSSRFTAGLGAEVRIELLSSSVNFNKSVAKIEYQTSPGVEYTVENIHFTLIFLIANRDSYDESHYDSVTKTGYITGYAYIMNYMVI